MGVVLLLLVPPLRADVVLAWNELLLRGSATAPDRSDPLAEARVYAMMHRAMADAVDAAGGVRNGSSSDLAAPRAAVVGAAHEVLSALRPGGRSGYAALADRLLSMIPDGVEKTRGLAMGRETAARMVSDRARDGWVPHEFDQTADGLGRIPVDTAETALARGDAPPPTPWVRAVPFRLKSVAQFAPREVRTVDRTGQVTNEVWGRAARAFEGLSPATVSISLDAAGPFVAWNHVARRAASERNLDLRDQARLLAALNVALADATIAALHWRRTLASWRVVVTERWDAVRGEPPQSTDVLAAIDGLTVEPVRRDTQFVLIPPTPDFPSVAATQAGAAQAALVAHFRSDDVAFTWPHDDAGVERESPAAGRRFTRISTAARERALLASLDGRHSREACLSGYVLGLEIGRYCSRGGEVEREGAFTAPGRGRKEPVSRRKGGAKRNCRGRTALACMCPGRVTSWQRFARFPHGISHLYEGAARPCRGRRPVRIPPDGAGETTEFAGRSPRRTGYWR